MLAAPEGQMSKRDQLDWVVFSLGLLALWAIASGVYSIAANLETVAKVLQAGMGVR